MSDLFARKIEMEYAEVFHYPEFFSKKEADNYFKNLQKNIPWQQDTIKVFGKTHLQPRLTAFFASNNLNYSYSNITMKPHHFSEKLKEIKHKIETETQHYFTSCLANLYRDGKDSNGWHADDEKELGKNPVIASVSFGTERVFKFRKKEDHKIQHKMILEHGSLLIMKGETQHFWQHQIPKTQKKIGERINLTFRNII
ncbi:alpha-ketoglutarate-dependent dioxygenase AlkB family protein [Mesonia maritima]|uniref:Alkylated DNA repair dioxygenase AlkB n=1 Tax=Mesonia maritima TaxID=1793873 RepID=A0ABU1K6C4_9FLAO|nr:alpha-ketoglutarate-dependent dioxygenase AlkB [Mesonia maritima]MDR6301158.1 alkylated DNA repair dioxygenase AlkB [Mesonia maritima]